VVGFALGWEGQAHGTLWITGDTVLYDGVRQVADRLQVDTALLHLGCVRFPVTGPVRYSMDAREAVELCRLVRPAPPSRPLRGEAREFGITERSLPGILRLERRRVRLPAGRSPAPTGSRPPGLRRGVSGTQR
jgi:hypothetical protein